MHKKTDEFFNEKLYEKLKFMIQIKEHEKKNSKNSIKYIKYDNDLQSQSQSQSQYKTEFEKLVLIKN